MFSFFGKSFEKAKYVESTEVLCNPDRGFFQMFTIVLGEKTDFSKLESCLVSSERLVFLLVDISAYKYRKLSLEAMTEFRKVLDFFSDRKKDIILRVVYDHLGQALEHEPDSFSLIKNHMEQIAKMLSLCCDNIFVYQGILVGNWGEMHTSKFLGKVKMREMVDILDNYLAGKLYLAVRRPCFYRQMRDELPAQQAEGRCKMGLYNDAILGSKTDMGTYGDDENTAWEAAWGREKELEFQEELCKHAPCGGESVWGDVFIHSLSVEGIIQTFQKMHLTYLNRLYDQKMLDYFKGLRVNEGAFKGSTLYQYLEAHLGYRFLVRDTNVHMGKYDLLNQRIKIEIMVENTGFSNIYRDGSLYLYVKDADGGRERKIEVGVLSKVSSGEKYVYEVVLPAHKDKKCKQMFYIGANRVFDHSHIYFGNKCEDDGRVYLGALNGIRIDEVC